MRDQYQAKTDEITTKQIKYRDANKLHYVVSALIALIIVSSVILLDPKSTTLAQQTTFWISAIFGTFVMFILVAIGLNFLGLLLYRKLKFDFLNPSAIEPTPEEYLYKYFWATRNRLEKFENERSPPDAERAKSALSSAIKALDDATDYKDEQAFVGGVKDTANQWKYFLIHFVRPNIKVSAHTGEIKQIIELILSGLLKGELPAKPPKTQLAFHDDLLGFSLGPVSPEAPLSKKIVLIGGWATQKMPLLLQIILGVIIAFVLAGLVAPLFPDFDPNLIATVITSAVLTVMLKVTQKI